MRREEDGQWIRKGIDGMGEDAADSFRPGDFCHDLARRLLLWIMKPSGESVNQNLVLLRVDLDEHTVARALPLERRIERLSPRRPLDRPRLDGLVEEIFDHERCRPSRPAPVPGEGGRVGDIPERESPAQAGAEA